MAEYKLPPLKREKIQPKSWFMRQNEKLDAVLAAAVNQRHSWLRVSALSLAKNTLRLTSYFGHTFPYVYRPWYWLSSFVRYRLDKRFEKAKVETVKTLFMRRLFSLVRPHGDIFHPIYAVVNWATLLVFMSLIPAIAGILVEGIYVYTTGDTYNDVIVTQAYRNITDQSTFSVHGYQELPNGQKKELYFEIGANLWHWTLYPEFVFGQVTVNGKCNFHTFGETIRIPRRLSMFSRGSLYVLNPWIIDLQCTAPSNVPK
jgi:hypothetical protein